MSLYTQLEASLGGGFFATLGETLQAVPVLGRMLETYGLTADRLLPQSMTAVFWRQKTPLRVWLEGLWSPEPSLFLVHELLIEASAKITASGIVTGIRTNHIQGALVWFLILVHARARGYRRLRGPTDSASQLNIEGIGVDIQDRGDGRVMFDLSNLNTDFLAPALISINDETIELKWKLVNEEGISRPELPKILKYANVPGEPSFIVTRLYLKNNDRWTVVRLQVEEDGNWMLLGIHTPRPTSSMDLCAGIHWAVLTATKRGIKEIYLNQYTDYAILRIFVDDVGFKPGQFYYHLVVDEKATDKALSFFVYN